MILQVILQVILPFCCEGAPAFRRGEESPSGWEESPGLNRGEDVKRSPAPVSTSEQKNPVGSLASEPQSKQKD